MGGSREGDPEAGARPGAVWGGVGAVWKWELLSRDASAGVRGVKGDGRKKHPQQREAVVNFWLLHELVSQGASSRCNILGFSTSSATPVSAKLARVAERKAELGEACV